MNDLVLNKIDSNLDYTVDQTRFIQTGNINNIDTSGLEPAKLLFQVITILRANSYTITNPTTIFDPIYPSITLQRIQVTGFTTDGVSLALHWGTPGFGTRSVFTIRKSARLTPHQTDLLPGLRIPLRIADTLVPTAFDMDGNAVGTDTYTIPGDNVAFTFLKPLEEIQIFALLFDNPKYIGTRMGNVNNADWPAPTYTFPLFFGHDPNNERKAKGYWLLTEWTTTESRYAGFYELNAAAVSRVNEDWSYSGMLRDHSTGKAVQIANADVVAAAMMAIPYSKGIIYNAYGMIRVGPYDTTDFTALFGF